MRLPHINSKININFHIKTEKMNCREAKNKEKKLKTKTNHKSENKIKKIKNQTKNKLQRNLKRRILITWN